MYIDVFNNNISASNGVMVNERCYPIIISEFDFHWVPHSPSLVTNQGKLS